MPNETRLTKPWLVAVWPGMGNVAVSAGYYLMAKLGMNLLAELPAQEFFDVEHVEIKGGIILGGRLPRSRVFAGQDPRGAHDLLVFIGEAQPPMGKYAYCRKLIAFAQELGVERVFTFAAMGTQMHPGHDSRAFGAATDEQGLEELRQLGLEPLDDGQISGLNGVLLGAAAEAGLRGSCLLGEMPHVFAQLPFPKASLTVLRVFAKLADIEIDLTELSEQAVEMDQRLGELLAQVEQQLVSHQTTTEEEEVEEVVSQEPTEEGRIRLEDEQRIEQLFKKARQDRSVAYEIKGELDRLGVYKDYEDRFLDLFRRSG